MKYAISHLLAGFYPRPKLELILKGYGIIFLLLKIWRKQKIRTKGPYKAKKVTLTLDHYSSKVLVKEKIEDLEDPNQGRCPNIQFSHKVVHKYLLNGDKNHMEIPFYKPHDMLDWGKIMDFNQ